MIPVSVCIIAKDEERNIGSCLEALAPHGLEIVVADTGSRDKTVEIARRFTDKVFPYAWTGDFAAARNFSIEHASFDWILAVDCDEILEKADFQRLAEFMEQHPKAVGRIGRLSHYRRDGQDGVMLEHISRFFSRNYYHYEGIIHEQVTPLPAWKNDKAFSPFASLDLPLSFLHTGYALSEEELQKKAERNILLLQRDLSRSGPDPYLYFQLGQTFFILQDYEQACTHFSQGLSMDVDPGLEYVKLMVESYGYSLIYTKRYGDALQFVNIYDDFCDRADFVFLMGLIYMNNAMFKEAIAEFLKAPSIREHGVEGVNSYLAFYNAGVIYECMGDREHALSCYASCGDYEPAASRLKTLGG